MAKHYERDPDCRPCAKLVDIIEARDNEIARLRGLMKTAYDEGYIAACGERGNITGNWDRSNAKDALDALSSGKDGEG